MARNRYFEDEKLDERFNGKMLRHAFAYAARYKTTLIWLIAVMLLMAFLSMMPTFFNKWIIDYVLTKEGVWGLDWLTVAIAIVAAWGLIGLSDVIYTGMRTISMRTVGQKIVYDMRTDLFRHLQRMSFDYYDSRPAGKILVRVTSYLDELANVFSSAVIIYVVEITKVILIFVCLYLLQWKLALLVTATVIPMAVIVFALRRMLARRHRAVRNKNSNRTAYLAEHIGGHFVSQTFNRGVRNGDINRELNAEFRRAWLHVVRPGLVMWPVFDFFFYLGLIGMYGAAMWLVLSGSDTGITVGTLISFGTFIGMFSGPFNNISNVTQQIAAAASNIERVFETMDTPPGIYDAADAIDLPPVVGRVTFEDVTFGYEKGQTVLEHFDLDVPVGKTIALVGPTGAGKTTVVNLISRFYDVRSGRVLVDGYDVTKVKLHSLRSQVGVMMQDTFVFAGTIMENIRYARPDATDEECIAAARAAHADEFIERLPQGYATPTSENGKGLSAGERQLLSFARVLLTDPRILILDEATSSIDTETENKIKQALTTVLTGRTSFVIAHRLSTIRRADCILYIADKGIAEAGTHDELMARHGLYRALVDQGCVEESADR